MVYASGTSSSVTTGNFAAMSVSSGYNGSVNFAPTFGSSEQRTAVTNVLAQRFAPPATNMAFGEYEKLAKYTKNWVIFGVLLAIISGFMVSSNVIDGTSVFIFLGLYVFTAMASMFAINSNLKALEKSDAVGAVEYKRWERSFLCFTCGNSFEGKSTTAA